jgi:alpha-tubulin suppressor-like RCC1 family protein
MTRNWLIRGSFLVGMLLVAACQLEPTNPTGSDRPNLVVIGSSNVFTQVDAGWSHTCGLRDDGVVECWGDNSFGQAPVTKAAASGAFTQVSAGGDYRAGNGGFHTCALRDDGVVECWGDNSFGQAPAIKTASGGIFIQVSAGGSHTCALRNDGDAECWGDNSFGQAPVSKGAIAAYVSFTQVSAGGYHTCARTDFETVECWGRNDLVQAPAILGGSGGTEHFVQVSAGHLHTCALRGAGTVACVGDNGSGQAPSGKAAASGAFTQASAGGAHTCALRDDAVVECWGDNSALQAPATRAASSGAFTQVSAGAAHTCALRDDGVAECWGNNSEGQAPATKVAVGTVVGHVFPTADFSASPNPVGLGQSFTLALANAAVDAPGSHSFTYAFDCGDGSGYGAFGGSGTAVCGTSALGTRTVKGTVRDEEGDQTEYTATVDVVYAFGGFLGPIDAPPVFNLVKAGAAVPAKFDLGGDQGMAILAAGYPRSQPIGCDGSAPTDPIEETVTAGNSSLSFDESTGLYTYVWKTEKAWASTCRLLTLLLSDGTEHQALFKFSR